MKNFKAQGAIASMITITVVVTALGLSIASIATIVKTTGFFHQKSEQAFYLAESGIEDGLIKLARDPNYTGESALPISSGNVTIMVRTEGSDLIVTSKGVVENITRKIEAKVNIDSLGKVSFVSWKEIK